MRWLRNKICNLTCNLPGLGHYSLWGTLSNPFEACIYYYYRQVKWFIQRGKRGYSDNDSWDLSGYLNDWMPKAIRSLKSEYGYPVQVYCEMFPDDDWTVMDQVHSALAHTQWHTILEKIAQGFEAGKKLDAFDYDGATEVQVLQDQLKEGLRLFGEYYQNLWD